MCRYQPPHGHALSLCLQALPDLLEFHGWLCPLEDRAKIGTQLLVVGFRLFHIFFGYAAGARSVIVKNLSTGRQLEYKQPRVPWSARLILQRNVMGML
jgi:hypothetical protein